MGELRLEISAPAAKKRFKVVVAHVKVFTLRGSGQAHDVRLDAEVLVSSNTMWRLRIVRAWQV